MQVSIEEVTCGPQVSQRWRARVAVGAHAVDEAVTQFGQLRRHLHTPETSLSAIKIIGHRISRVCIRYYDMDVPCMGIRSECNLSAHMGLSFGMHIVAVG